MRIYSNFHRAAFILAIICSPSSFAAAGGMEGGGGKSVVCRNSAGQIESAELLDLYEGRSQHKFAIQNSDEKYEEQVARVLSAIGKGRGIQFTSDLIATAAWAQRSKTLLPGGVGLVDIADSHHVVLSADCKVEQLANFIGSNQLLINGEIWSYLDATNKAALIVHEALYKAFRNFGTTDSVRVRRAVAIGFAGGVAEDIYAGLPSDAFECVGIGEKAASRYTRFYAFDNGSEMTLQFDAIDGAPMLTKSTVHLEKVNEDKDRGFWLQLISGFENGAPVAISFQPKAGLMKIGMEPAPKEPQSQFVCLPKQN